MQNKTIKAIFNPTKEEILKFFGFDISNKYDSYERVLTCSIAENKNLNQVHYSIVTTNNRVDDMKNNKGFAWIGELI